MERAIALVDCNAFFCSCEQLFAPKWKGRPVIVLSNNDGCVVSRTKEAKALGIKMCAPYFQIKSICQKEGVGVFSSNFSLYTDISKRVMRTLKTFAQEVEVYSVDEAFLQVDPGQDFYAMKKEVERLVGIPVSIGIAPNKVLAKMSNYIAKDKPELKGVLSLMRREAQDFYLSKTPVREIWGIGEASSKKLQLAGIKTAKDLRDDSRIELIRSLISISGVHLQEELKGKEFLIFSNEMEKKKEILCSRTFPSATYDFSQLATALSSYVADAAGTLRSQQQKCRQLAIFIQTDRHAEAPQNFFFKSVHFFAPTSDTRELIKAALELLQEGFQAGYGYRRAGAVLSHFESEEFQRLSLFPDENDDSDELMSLVDEVGEKFGANMLHFAAEGADKGGYEMQRHFKSPRFTTEFSELKKVY